MKEIEVEGKTVTHAVEKGLSELGLRRDQVEVEVLEEGSPGFLGMGLKLAKVKLREKIWGETPSHAPEKTTDDEAPSHKARAAAAPGSHGGSSSRRHAPERSGHSRPVPYKAPPAERPDPKPSPIHEAPPDPDKACAEAKALLEELLQLMRIEHPSVLVSWDPKQVRVRAEVETPDTQIVIGKEGRTLEALQFITTLVLGRRIKSPVAVQVECAGFWQGQEESILLQVHQAMEMVQRTKRPVRLKPMDSFMRRLVHRTLVGHPEFETTSEGEGSWRKVVIKPRHK